MKRIAIVIAAVAIVASLIYLMASCSIDYMNNNQQQTNQEQQYQDDSYEESEENDEIDIDIHKPHKTKTYKHYDSGHNSGSTNSRSYSGSSKRR